MRRRAALLQAGFQDLAVVGKPCCKINVAAPVPARIFNISVFAESVIPLSAVSSLAPMARSNIMYEDGMQIIWDVIEKSITVIFRGKIYALPMKFSTRQLGIDAGENRCRDLGWIPG